jgi:predicted GH43/DUF377 family glycosyl hydrolase
MLRRLNERLLVRPEDLEPSQDGYQVVGVFNPGATAYDGGVVLLLRVAELAVDVRDGQTPLPRWEPGDGLVTDWVDDDALERREPRGVRLATGYWRLTSTSHLRLAHSSDGLSIDSVSGPVLAPNNEMDEYGIEDPRITVVDGRYYITYVSVSRHGIATALASTTDFVDFERHGIIFPPENKDVVLFPERIGSAYVALHRPMSRSFTPPQIWTARSGNLSEWGDHRHLVSGAFEWEGERIGAGPPPIRTPEGWLELHHGSSPAGDREMGIYAGGALLLDLDDPDRILARTPAPILTPTAPYEREGFVRDVVFPTGLVQADDTLLVYYGAADTSTAVAELSMAEVRDALVPVEA